jgi:hypothetical protein
MKVKKGERAIVLDPAGYQQPVCYAYYAAATVESSGIPTNFDHR